MSLCSLDCLVNPILRKIRPAEVEEVISWWGQYGEIYPEPGMMPEDSTFIIEWNGVPSVSVTVFHTNCMAAWIDNFIANPTLNYAERSAVIYWAWDLVQQYVKEQGYKRMFCFSDKESTVRLYKRFGFIPTLTGVVTMTKEVV